MLLLGRFLQRPKMPSLEVTFRTPRLGIPAAAFLRTSAISLHFSAMLRHLVKTFYEYALFVRRPFSAQDISASSASWMLVDMLTWPSRPSKASPAASANSPAADNSRCSQGHTTTSCSNNSNATASKDPAEEPQIASTGNSMQMSVCSTKVRSRVAQKGRQQVNFSASARKSNSDAASARRATEDVQIVRPSRLPMRRAASCPEEPARQPHVGCCAAAALRSHSLTPEAWEDLHGGVASSTSLRSHSLELHPDDGVHSVGLASHQILLEAGSVHGSFADLASLADAEGECSVGADVPDHDAPAGGNSLARSASASSSVDDASFHDALDAQVISGALQWFPDSSAKL